MQSAAPRSAVPVAARLVLLVALWPVASFPAPANAVATLNRAEAQLHLVFQQVERGQLKSALEEVEQLIARHPNFLLAHLVRGDLLLARVRPIATLGNTGHAGRERLDDLRAEAAARLRAYHHEPPASLIPRYLLQLSPEQQHAIVVDSGRSRIYVYENKAGVPRLVEDYYTTLGKYGIEKVREGDKKTPIGVYNVTASIPGSKLPDLYGWGAFPINYPNAWDRRLGKTGYGIWFHGVPSDTYARPPWASDGCIALANPDIEQLAKRVQIGNTPVVISASVEWVTPQSWRTEREAFARYLETWRKDWESLDSDRYLAHYARAFRSRGMALPAWQDYKRRVNSRKTWIKVSLSNVSVFRSPGTQDLVTVTYDQDYRSSNLKGRTRKQQYWIMEDGRWKIAYEAVIRPAPLVLPESFPRGKQGFAPAAAGGYSVRHPIPIQAVELQLITQAN
jgi:murein L,D-transpeptidase YafK